MTQLFKTIKVPEELRTTQTTEEQEECEHESMNDYDTIETDFDDDRIIEIRRYYCDNCDYWEEQRWTAPIGEYDYEDTIDCGHN